MSITTLQQIKKELDQEFYERTDIIHLLFVSLLCKEHAYLFGPPGTGKSSLIRAICERFCDTQGNGLTSFKYLMSKFTKPEELFGSVDIQAMKQGDYRVITTKRLPEAQIVFLDEAPRSSNAIINTLLTLMEERIFYNGATETKTDIMCFFFAANSIPTEEELMAWWDRVGIRIDVKRISDSKFEDFLVSRTNGKNGHSKTTMSQIDLRSLQDQVKTVTIPRSVLTMIARLRSTLEKDKGIIPSDRRWECLHHLQANALLEGRKSVDEDDLDILKHMLWESPDQRADVAKIINKLSNPMNAKAVELKDQANDFYTQYMEERKKYTGADRAIERMNLGTEYMGKMNTVHAEIEKIKNELDQQGKTNKKIDEAFTRINELRETLVRSIL